MNLSELTLRIDATRGKPSRKAAREAFVQYLATGDDEHLVSLAYFFADSLPAKPKTLEQWVASACATPDDKRTWTHVMHVENGVAYATNGHVLLEAPTQLADGRYNPAAGLSRVGDEQVAALIPYPVSREKRLAPIYRHDYKLCEFNRATFDAAKGRIPERFPQVQKLAKGQPLAVARKYVEQAFAAEHLVPDAEPVVEYSGNGGPYRITLAPGVVAYVMPLVNC